VPLEVRSLRRRWERKSAEKSAEDERDEEAGWSQVKRTNAWKKSPGAEPGSVPLGVRSLRREGAEKDREVGQQQMERLESSRTPARLRAASTQHAPTLFDAFICPGEVRAKTKSTFLNQKHFSNSRKWERLAKDEERNSQKKVMIAEVSEETWTRESGLIFNVADVAKPLASAVKVCEAGNRVVLDLSKPGMSYVENIKSGERMQLTKEKGTFVFEVKFTDDGTTGKITLDSGAGVSVWPKAMKQNLEMLPKDESLKMIAANGTKIENYGKKVVKFQGLQPAFSRRT
jgi:hypothetical protein